jgi:aminoglycoside phosphotransferase (APT) family kinase protein
MTDLAALAHAVLPGRRVVVRREVGHGWDSAVLLTEIDGADWVLRFARRPEVALDFDREAALLRLLRPALPVAVPDWQVDTVVDGHRVVGYPAVPGSPAGEEPHGDGDFELVRPGPPPVEYVSTLAAVLSVLHALPDASRVLGPAPDPSASRDHWAAAVDALVDPPPAPLLRWWADRFADDRLWRATPVPTHGDLHPGHTFVGPDGALTAIIDWTDAGWADPVVDLVDQRHVFGAGHAAALLARGDYGEHAAERLVLRQSLGPVAAARWAREHDRPDLLTRARQRLAQQADRLAAGLDPV